MENEFVAYRKFLSVEEAAPFAELFKLHNIEYTTESYKPLLGYPYVFSNQKGAVEIKILREQVETADKLLESEARKAIQNLPPDYYLFTFTDDELWDVLIHPLDWTVEDYILAQALLKEHGKQVNQTELDYRHIEDLKKPKHLTPPVIALGFFLCFIGILPGILIGLFISLRKKTVHTGEKVYSFDTISRRRGILMVVFGIIVLILGEYFHHHPLEIFA